MKNKQSREEGSINGTVGDYIRNNFKPVFTVTEVPKTNNRKNERPDILIYNDRDEKFFTAVECKTGQSKIIIKNVVNQAKRWLIHPYCWNIVGMCYPKRFADEETIESLTEKIKNSEDILFIRLNSDGTIGTKVKGGIERQDGNYKNNFSRINSKSLQEHQFYNG